MIRGETSDTDPFDLAIDGGTTQIHQPLPAHGMHVVFAISNDSRHNCGRSHGVGLLEGLVTNKDKDLRYANTFTATTQYSRSLRLRHSAIH